VPLVAGGRAIGSLALAKAERPFDDDEVAFVEALARQAGLALERARLYEREHAVAETLQRSVIPEEPPALEGVAVAARYQPGSPGLEVGGDWYDVIQLPTGEVGAAVGDVVGKGVTAASAMAQLRNALRAYALEGFPPGSVLERLNRLADVSGAQFATLVYLVLDPRTGTCRYAAAGHPPALLVRPDGRSEFLEAAGSLPVGVSPDTDYTDATVQLEPGATLVLYTDGLVESRAAPLDEGLHRLRARAEVAACAPVESLLDELVELLPDAERKDDVAVMALKLAPVSDRLALELPADLGALRMMRGELRAWLERSGVSPEDIHDICVASWEACANAIEHPQHPLRDTIELVARNEAGTVAVTVRDSGRWKPKASREDRGLGLRLIEGLMDELTIDATSRGTRVTMRRSLRERVPV
jgi:serine phosphatase RsbU (regulator of sigma subunit)